MGNTIFKPPIGLRPRYISDGERLHEIKEAFIRYFKENMVIPDEWLEEYNEIAERVNNKEDAYISKMEQKIKNEPNSN